MLDSIAGVQRTLRTRGELDAASILDDLVELNVGDEDNDICFRMTSYRLLRECRIQIPFMMEDAAGVHMIALQYLDDQQWEIEMELHQYAVSRGIPKNDAEKLSMMVDHMVLRKQMMDRLEQGRQHATDSLALALGVAHHRNT